MSADCNADPWSLCERELDLSAHAATIFSLANGAFGVRGGLEECANATQATFLAAAWDRYPLEYHERHSGFARTTDTRLPVADAAAIGIALGRTDLGLETARCLEHERTLHFRRGTTTRSTTWQLVALGSIVVTAERLVSLANPNLFLIRLRVRSLDYDGEITLSSTIHTQARATARGDDPRLGVGAGHRLKVDATGYRGETAWVRQSAHHRPVQVLCAQRHAARGLTIRHAPADAGAVAQVFHGRLAAGTEVTLDKFVVYDWQAGDGEAGTDLTDRAMALLERASTQGFEAASAEQARILDQYWNSADFELPSASDAERALRYSQFQLFQNASRDGADGFAAKGLTGEGYEGHVFWDTEAFILPALTFQCPGLARRALEWRIRLLDRARAHARELNLERGALYPWRTISGDECSAHYPSGSAQFHINAAIAYAIVLYLRATGDRELLAQGAAEVLFETARIWPQLGHFDARRNGAFCIHTVTGPDEYTALVDNNFYTNRMAQWHLLRAVEVARELLRDDPATYGRLCTSLKLDEEELRQWTRIAASMYLPYDPGLGVIEQDDSFLHKPRWDLAGTPAGQFPLLLHHHPMTLYRHQVCKQADVLQALVLAGEEINVPCKRRTFDYYEHVTAHDSTLSAASFSIVAADVGYTDFAHQYFRNSLFIDLDNLHGNTGHGLHMASIAGSWLALAWGLGGVRMASDGGLHLNPSLPREWREYSFKFRWRGRRLQVHVNAERAECRLLEGEAMRLFHRDVPRELTSVLQLGLRERPAPAGAVKALLFDLDGVLANTAVLHYRAWKRLADEIGVPFDTTVNLRLKGVDRKRSLEILLERSGRNYSAAEREALAARKNGYFLEYVAGLGPTDVLPGARRALLTARGRGMKTAVASASHNASAIIGHLGLADLFDHVVDASRIPNGKPAPDIFLAAARALGVTSGECIGIEDAEAGVEAIKSAGMYAIGIGEPQHLPRADVVFARTADLEIEQFLDDGSDRSLMRTPAGVRAL